MDNKSMKFHGFECSIQELEDGYAINIKGDKEKLKAKLELIEAYLNYREKAKAAGFSGHGHHSCKGGFLGHVHEHFKAMHKKQHHCTKED